jgi:hypothetical protein
VDASRHAAAWRRARIAKIALATVGALTFIGGTELVRLNIASHHKVKLQPLGAPTRFTDIVRQNLLQAGIMAPAQAPPGAETALS